MKERPILFSAPMVRAILDGKKTQTRRIIKLQTWESPLKGTWDDESVLVGGYIDGPKSRFDTRLVTCPYGKVGDRLWVRETWAPTDSDGGPVIAYKAGGYLMHGSREGADETFPGDAGQIYDVDAWRPSIHMPRWASRLLLEITEVRVQRLNEISEEGARAEGFRSLILFVCPECRGECRTYRSADDMDIIEGLAIDGQVERTCSNCGGRGAVEGSYADIEEWGEPVLERSAVEEFRRLWDSINAKKPGCSWADNPWIWAITFKRVTP